MSHLTKYKFRLYITGDTANSVQAQANLIELCQTHLHDRYEIEVVDLLQHEMTALDDFILMTPTLVRLSPLPVRRVIGSLSQIQVVLDSIL